MDLTHEPDEEQFTSAGYPAPEFRSLAESARVATELPEALWTRQRAAIRSRIAVEQASKRPLKRFVLASAFALIALVMVLLRTSSPPPAAEAQTDPDDQLLISVEQAIQNNGPEALAPAALLADDISSAQAKSQQSQENPYAN